MFKLTTHSPWNHLVLALIIILGVSEKASCTETDFITVKDGRGVLVKVPADIKRVATISDGMVEQVMTRFGIASKIVATGSECIPKKWNPTYPGSGDKKYTYHGGMHTVTYLNPRLMEIPLITRYGTGINYEKLALLKPDVLIARMGSCSLSGSREVMKKSLSLVEALGIPVVVLQAPDTYETPDAMTIYQEIRILGEVFNKKEEGEKMIDFLEVTLESIQNRTRTIPNAEKKKILLLGLSPKARSDGGAGDVRGTDTIENYLLREFVNADNACNNPAAWSILNTEQILSLDPDVIILITAWGYHPPRELYEAPYYQSLKHLRAVKNHQVAALPFTPCNCEKRLGFPIDVMVMASTAYPSRFKDINLASWMLNFYQNLYGIDVQKAKGLRSCQWMDWTLGADFE